ncbi:MAG: recombinase family protein [Faecalibacterium sp.]|nr:recombinase family protein [Ruminococcus sp.]MCM1393060.1 recombinase family protein [Ruminococcus sp.]MCM1485340.1 recombinase family protein [Faecalibacterium sp.]
MHGNNFDKRESNIGIIKGESGATLFIPAKDKADLFGSNHIFRTCAYCRVSTDRDEQLSSFELQQDHYRRLVSNHSNWELKHIFADEGISGTSLKNRDEFNDMISRCIDGEFDLIVTKSVSRFARNLVDCVSLVRKLKNLNHPVGVFFETDNLFTLSEDSELKLTILATFAQEESIKKSESMNWSLKERFKSKKLLTPELFGYRRPRDAVGNYVKHGKLEIEESEAEVVRFIYNAFLSGFSIKSICNILEDIGCETKLGNTKWSEGSVSYILKNERYCGNVLTWKQFTSDVFEHKKRKNRQDRDQYLYTDVHEAIITVQQFDAVQELFENRKHGYKGSVPIMHVIDGGALSGYVPINHHWASDDPCIYYNASNSIQIYKEKTNIMKNYFSKFDLSGYQVVRGNFLSSRSELPAISLSKEKIVFNCVCARKFDFASHIQLLLHSTERKIAIRACSKKDMNSIPWHKNMNQPISTKVIACSHFCSVLYQIMEWFPDYMYKVTGTFIEKGNDKIIIFNLSEAMPYVTIKEKTGGDDKTINKKAYICPEEWGDSFGSEFYNFSLDNILYYLPPNTSLGANEKSRPIDGQLSFEILNDIEVMKCAETLKQKAGKKDE